MVQRKFSPDYQINYLKKGATDVLKSARDYIHTGHTLLTHPLAGSIKPNETPYKSVMLEAEKKQLNFESVKIIEESIHTCEKFVSTARDDHQEVLIDFQYVDCSLIENAIAQALM